MTYTLVKRPQPAKKEQQPETKKPNPKRNRPAPANTAEPSPTTVFPGSLDDIAPLASVRIQAKLSVGSPDDPHEQEADHIAAKVVSEMESTSSEPSRPSPSLPDERLVQRKCTTPAATFDGSPKFSERLQRARAQGGQPLAPTIRAAMERGFGADFTAVQIHHDEQAASLAQQIGARAFTVGSDVFFNRGEHRPAMRAGRELLAHELSHVLQQRTSGETLDRKRKLAPSFETAKPGQLGYRIALAEGSEFGEPGVASGPPLGHSFEIVDGRLIATLRTPVDIHGVQQLLEIINAKELDPSRRGPPFIPPPVGLPFFIVKLDITSFLPTTIRKFMVDHGDFLRHTREFSKLEEPPAEDDGKARAVWEGLFDTYAKMRDDPINRSMGNAAVLTKAKKSSTRIPKEGLRQAWNANCHEFAALLFRSAHLTTHRRRCPISRNCGPHDLSLSPRSASATSSCSSHMASTIPRSRRRAASLTRPSSSGSRLPGRT